MDREWRDREERQRREGQREEKLNLPESGQRG